MSGNRARPKGKMECLMGFEKGRALVIGIANYWDVKPLPDAVLCDARDFASILQDANFCGYPVANVKLLLDEQASLEAIRAAMADLASSAGPDDTVVIFFSGHGARFSSGPDVITGLVPVDCKRSDPVKTLVQEAELSAALSAINAKRLLVLIDACHSGGAGVLKGDLSDGLQLGFSDKTLHSLAQGAGRVIIASSRATETSLVLDGARNSVFTEKLIEALKGRAHTAGDGLIRVFEVFNYVSERVRVSVPGLQHPIFKATDVEDNFPIALNLGGTKSVAGAAPSSSGKWRDLEQIMPDLYPLGPTDQEIWVRAGGDVSRLKLNGTGRANWFSALRALKLGGGGQGINQQSLVRAALDDFPHHVELDALK